MYIEFHCSDNYNRRYLECFARAVLHNELHLHLPLRGTIFTVFELCEETGGT